MATLEELIAEELAAIKAGDTIYKSVNGVKKPMTDNDLENIANTRGNNKFDQQENGYKYAREAAYPELKEQFDLIWHAIDKDKLDKTSDFYKQIKKIKDDNPKPS
jgi:hypothetical protein|tara:strand:+ start:4338 stop:4652 length:315 start_codon:yes stop_codon:yes gene_type:complete